MKISLDTNILIDSPQIVFDDSREFVISFTVLRELDKLKRNPDLKRSAQQAIRNIKVQLMDGKIEILNVPGLDELGDSPDEHIIKDTIEANAQFLTEDINASVIAKALGIPLSDFEAEDPIDYDYKGYITIQGTTEYEKKFVQVKEMPLEEFNTLFDVDMKENMYCIIERVVDKDDIWLHRNGVVSRISQSMKPFRDAGVLLSPMDSMQMCALHAVFDSEVPLTVIDGRLGTGKTLLALAGILGCTIGQKRYQIYDTVYVSKPPISTNKDLYTGFKPGTSADKLGGHLGGIKSNLEFLLDKREDKFKVTTSGEKMETPSDIVWNSHFAAKEIDEAQGDSLHNSCWIIDEHQLLNRDGEKMCLSRISEGSKILLIGDTQGQTYGLNRGNEGFKPLFEHFGTSPDFSYIKLDNIYRSRLAKLVDKIYN